MKRVLALITSLMCVISLVGCSSGGSGGLALKSDGYGIYNGKEVLSVVEHRGYEATQEVSGVGTIEYYVCNTADNCIHNDVGVYMDNMTKFKDGLYYSAYLSTHIVYYYPYNGEYIECYCKLNKTGAMSIEEVVELMHNEAEKLALTTEDIPTVSFTDAIDINVSGKSFKLRANELVIPNLIRAYIDDGSIKTDKTLVVGDTIVNYAEKNNYKYYVYNGVIIQTSVAVNFEDYIILKEQ